MLFYDLFKSMMKITFKSTMNDFKKIPFYTHSLLNSGIKISTS